jgi:hypothetical protein
LVDRGSASLGEDRELVIKNIPFSKKKRERERREEKREEREERREKNDTFKRKKKEYSNLISSYKSTN